MAYSVLVRSLSKQAEINHLASHQEQAALDSPANWRLGDRIGALAALDMRLGMGFCLSKNFLEPRTPLSKPSVINPISLSGVKSIAGIQAQLWTPIFGNGSLVNQTSPWQPQPTFRGHIRHLFDMSRHARSLCLVGHSPTSTCLRVTKPPGTSFAPSRSGRTPARRARGVIFPSPGKLCGKLPGRFPGFFAPELVRCSSR